jgi:hypothetical protein
MACTNAIILLHSHALISLRHSGKFFLLLLLLGTTLFLNASDLVYESGFLLLS